MKKTALKAILLLILGTQLDASDLLECESGDALACYELAKLNSEKYENIKAAIFFEKSCEGGYAPACTKLAEKYLYGVGVVGSRDKAVALYDKACEEGDGEEYQRYCDSETGQCQHHTRAFGGRKNFDKRGFR